MSRNVIFIVAAVVAFILAAVLVFVGGVDHKIIDALLFGGLASFAAGHLG